MQHSEESKRTKGPMKLYVQQRAEGLADYVNVKGSDGSPVVVSQLRGLYDNVRDAGGILTEGMEVQLISIYKDGLKVKSTMTVE